MKRFISLICCLSILASLLLLININNINASATQKLFEESLKETAVATGHSTGESPTKAAASLPEKIGKAVNMVLSLVGVFFLGLMIYGGYVWMLARGNEQEAEKAKNIIINSITGIFIVLAAYAATAFISNYLVNPAIGK